MTFRLLGLARAHWAVFDGWAASRNVDPIDLVPDRFLSLVYFWSIQHADGDERAKFDRRLWMPPKGVEPAPGSPWSVEAETAAFGSLAAQVGAKKGAGPTGLREGSDVGKAP